MGRPKSVAVTNCQQDMSYPPLDPWGNIQRCQKKTSYWQCNLLTGAGECLSEQPEGDEGKQSEIDCISLHIYRHLRLPSRESFFAKQENQRNFRSLPVRLPCAWSDTSWRGTRILWTGFYHPHLLNESLNFVSGCLLSFQQRGCSHLQGQTAYHVPS